MRIEKTSSSRLEATDFNNLKFGEILQANGLNRHCDDILYNPFTGEQIHTNIFFGPTYYQRLKIMVADKVHSRATGKLQSLVRQPVGGKSNNGGGNNI